MIAPSAAFARHEAIVLHLHRGLTRRCGASEFSLLSHELRALAERNIGINPSKRADVIEGGVVQVLVEDVDGGWGDGSS